ncbi:phospho-sugar mutase [Agrococcus sp. SCSIO52902]|uniref:phospho-sugar mutase n=1 Tax=Agrococcus sp. SCSIO52902 TaxID=2933290 RepID=UPI001FF47B20|nr:phospho-sugar mutase [Agrococcus sp. SCSIO52902]UOW01211.1 phospho-sugar mutase [Agrococcus sp. SCSIO52902]
MSAAPEAVAAARAWLAGDPDETTRAELEATIASAEAGDDAAIAELADAFRGRLQFGTAGLRGRIAPGPNRMNRVVVQQASAGLAAFLLSREPHPSVVVGWDGRRGSERFARDTAEVLAGAGVRAILLPRLMPTPVTAFAVRHLGASAGVMVTASHNPPADNGYKVYLGGDDEGSQIVPPIDAEIAARIAEAAETPVADYPRGEPEVTGDAVWRAYVAATAAIGQPDQGVAGATSGPRVVYTPLHGVGLETVEAVLAEAGFPPVIPVPEQSEPDGAFPTVDFPNPEEPGALDLAMALGTAEQADLIIANDPDADRLAVAVPDASAPMGWRMLTGNEVGLLLGWDAARTARGQGVLAASIVSSPGLGAIARAHGLEFVQTLTGFKWVSRVPGLVYGYEEALGYLVNPGTVRDKDGISALVRLLTLASDLHERGSSLGEELLALAGEFGAFASGQVSVRVSDLARIPAIMASLRAAPPAELAGSRVLAADDLALPEHGSIGDILRFTLDDGSRVMVRPSGTEPKVKVYIDASSTDGAPAARVRAARERVAAIADAVRPLLA